MQIEIKSIYKSFYSNDGGSRKIFADFSYTINEPDFITIIGPNGCGKSTLLNMIAGIEHPDSGSINLRHGTGGKNGIGYVWQNFRSSLLPWLNVYQNIEFPLRLKKMVRQERKNIIEELLNEFKVPFDSSKEVYKLSGGQQQLVCLLRSIASKPELLLCDEPFSALDQSSRWTMAFYLEQLWLKKQVPVLFVSHDIDESILLGNKIMLFNKNGHIEKVLENNLPRPRSIQMLTSDEHITLRTIVIEFMKENGAIRDLSQNN